MTSKNCRGRSRKGSPLKRLFDKAKRGMAYLVCISLIVTSLQIPVTFAAEEDAEGSADPEYSVFSMTLGDICDMIEEAVNNCDPLEEEPYVFSGDAKEAYEELFDISDGQLYEIDPEISLEGAYDLSLRTFVRVDKDVINDFSENSDENEETGSSYYNVTGNEEVIFLFVNDSNEEAYVAARITASDDNIYQSPVISLPEKHTGITLQSGRGSSLSAGKDVSSSTAVKSESGSDADKLETASDEISEVIISEASNNTKIAAASLTVSESDSDALENTEDIEGSESTTVETPETASGNGSSGSFSSASVNAVSESSANAIRTFSISEDYITLNGKVYDPVRANGESAVAFVTTAGELGLGGDGIRTLAYESSGSGRVVINLGNSNGLCGFADYSGHRTTDYPTDLRYTTEVLDAYADDNGNLTIHLPADEDLGTTFVVVEGINLDNPAVTIALGNCAAYPYTLVGWVNIATGEYYEAGEEVEINLGVQNVFYADWIAASYDHGSSDDPDVIETVSTKDFVRMHLYDFNEIFNMYSAEVDQSVEVDGSTGEATITETWSDSGTMYDTLMGANLENGSKQTNSFIFVNDGASSASGNVGYVSNQTAGNKWTGTGGYPRNAYEQWGITSPESAPLNVLFDPSEKYYGVHYVGEGDYLFQIDEDGYYFYNSDKNTATYNQTDGRFYVYDGTQSVANVSFPCFLPFNDYYSTLGALDGTVDYWFGMDMSVNFYLSNAVGRGGNLVNGKHMVFNFSGDDDILIFIDNELILDMSGIHDESFGSIDFTDGTVKLAMSEEGLATADSTSFSLGAGNHELEVYYLERGARASNLEIEFNIMPLWEYESGPVQTVTAEKVWQNADGSIVADTSYMPVVEVGLFDVVTAGTDDDPGYTVDEDTYTFEYIDDKNVYHKYEYTVSSEGDSLTYAEGNTTVTYSDTNSDGKVIDDKSLVIAWFEDEKLHLRIDEQTLSSENDWFYAWELLDADGEYEALELSESGSYTTTTESEDLTSYQYWSIIGESEIAARVTDNDSDYPVILTEAAQEAESSIGDTKEAYGWVIVGTTSGVETTQVKFSQIATMEEIENVESNTKSYHGVYGVTSQSEIEALGSGAVWYMEDANKAATDIDGETSLEEFRLYCILDGTKYYLALERDSNGLTTSAEFGATFYYDALGELMVDITDDDGNSSTVRVEILADGSLNIDEAEEAAAVDDVRIYSLSETETSGFAFTATNTLTYSFKLDKVETDKEDEVLDGATFSLYEDADCTQIIGFVAFKDEDKNIIYTVSDDSDADGYTEVIEAGWVTIAGMSFDTFYLKELTAPSNDYVHLNEVIEVRITGNDDGSVTVTVDGAPTHVTAKDDTIIVDNDQRGKTAIAVEKAWDDADDQDGVRPGSITFHLFADEAEVDSATVTAADGWAYTFTDLPIYREEDDGNDHIVEILYTVTEDPIEGYTTEIVKAGGETADGYTVTNTHTPATTSVTVSKIWYDESLSQVIRPSVISVQLYADGVAYSDAVTLMSEIDWTYTWNKLPVYSAGKAIEYTVEEADITGYTPTYGEITGDADSGYAIEITNEPSPEELSICKVVAGTTNTTEYKFQITLEIGGSPYDGDIEVTYSSDDTTDTDDTSNTVETNDTLSFKDGIAEFTLKSGQTITLTLLYGMSWEIEELTEGMDSTVIYVNNEIADEASGTIESDTPVRFVNSYRGFYPIDEEIVPDYTERSTWVKDEAVNEYNAIEIEMSTIIPVITPYDLENGEFTMNFHEELDHELVLDEVDSDFMVFIDGNQIDHQYYTITLTSDTSPAAIRPFANAGVIDDDCTFHVDVDLTDLYKDKVITEKELQGNTEIIIFFFADLEGTGLNGTYKSTVWYDVYDGDELLYTSDPDEVYVYTYEIDITKYDSSVLTGDEYDRAALAGATLGLYYDAEGNDPVSRNGEPYEVVSGENGRAIFHGLSDGTYYIREVSAPEGFMLSGDALKVELGEDLNDKGYMFETAFANTPTTLTISKTVTGSGGSTSKDFTFTVDAELDGEGITGEYDYEKTDSNGEVTTGKIRFEDGKSESFTLRHNESIIIKRLPAGVNYTVTESDNSGYTVTIDGNGGSGTISSTDGITVSFTNYRGSTGGNNGYGGSSGGGGGGVRPGTEGGPGADVTGDDSPENDSSSSVNSINTDEIGELPGTGEGNTAMILIGVCIALVAVLVLLLYMRRRTPKDQK